MRYASENNFVGARIDGYETPRCLFTVEAVNALEKVFEDLKVMGHRLRIYDSYRP